MIAGLFITLLSNHYVQIVLVVGGSALAGLLTTRE